MINTDLKPIFNVPVFLNMKMCMEACYKSPSLSLVLTNISIWLKNDHFVQNAIGY